MAAAPESCVVCGTPIEGDACFVLARGRRREVHCSDSCLHVNVDARRRARAATRRRWFLRLLLVVLLLGGGREAWQRFRAPQPQSISYAWLEDLPEPPAAPAPNYFGPAWPPTDEDWTTAFAGASWVYPLPGPARRPTRLDGRIFGPEPAKKPSLCRQPGRCGVDLGGQLWGEHVYAVLDGVVDRVQGVGSDARGGGHYVRLSHFGGMVFTQYFHLAATPRGLGRGARVKAGDVIGLVGDTGLDGERRHLHFALSVRPSSEFPEVYWDPDPLMAGWPLRVPPLGTVAGFVSSDRQGSPRAVRPIR